MEKLRLDCEKLRVESFPTAPAAEETEDTAEEAALIEDDVAQHDDCERKSGLQDKAAPNLAAE